MSDSSSKRGPIRFLFENSLFLVAGALGALIWANTDNEGYQEFVHYSIAKVHHADEHSDDHAKDDHAKDDHAKDDHAKDDHAKDDHAKDDHAKDDHAKDGDKSSAGHSEPAGTHAEDKGTHEGEKADGQEAQAGAHESHGLTIHFLINDILMALFFAIAAKEVWESMLPGGALSNPRKAATPLLATLGGVIGPAALYLGGAFAVGQMATLGQGWAVPCATDIAFSYLVARLVFGAGHPAIAFLLLLAIADDALGLVILAVAYPSRDLAPVWFLLTAAAVALSFTFRKAKLQSFWWYLLIPGTMSWFSFYSAGIHPALGLVPIIPCMPHAHTDLGIFARDELHRSDTLNAFEHWWKNPVELILGLFGLVNAGVVMSAVGAGTWLVLIGLLIGKPLGITLFTLFAEKVLKLEMPAGMTYRHIISIGLVAAIGFTVALFVSTAAFPAGAAQDSVKMGALLSFGAAFVAYIGARMMGIRAVNLDDLDGPKKPAPPDKSDADLEKCLA